MKWVCVEYIVIHIQGSMRYRLSTVQTHMREAIVPLSLIPATPPRVWLVWR